MAVLLYKDGEQHTFSLRQTPDIQSLLDAGYHLTREESYVRRNEKAQHEKKGHDEKGDEEGEEKRRHDEKKARMDAIQKRLDDLPDEDIRKIGRDMKIGNWHNRKIDGLKEEILNGEAKV